jgi:hypothetical protein
MNLTECFGHCPSSRFINLLKWPMFTRVNAHKKTLIGIYFIYLGNKEIYCIFKTCCIMAFVLPQNAIYFINLSPHVQMICFS